MYPKILYIFKCGCNADNYLAKNVNRDGIPATVRLCPRCADPALSDRTKKNKACSLSRMEAECMICGKATTISKNATTNIRLILCSRHKPLRNSMNRQSSKDLQKSLYNYPKGQTVFAICPYCEKQHSVTATNFATKTPRKYCLSCKRQVESLDSSFAEGNALFKK